MLYGRSDRHHFQARRMVRITSETKLHTTQLGFPSGVDDDLSTAGMGRISPNRLPGSETVLALSAAQIALNTFWTPVFFGANRIGAAMVILTLLWIVVAAMVVMALRLDIVTGLILFPYLLWLSLAAALNFSILRHNK
jgi:hypothetical protein